MGREEIVKKIGEIFKERLNINMAEKDFNEPVVGPEWNLLPSDLVYIFFDLEKAFGIQITEEDIDNECLFTVEAMINMIEGSKLLVKWVLPKTRGIKSWCAGGSYKMNMVKFYKKRGKAIWKRKFILQKKNGQSAKRWLMRLRSCTKWRIL